MIDRETPDVMSSDEMLRLRDEVEQLRTALKGAREQIAELAAERQGLLARIASTNQIEPEPARLLPAQADAVDPPSPASWAGDASFQAAADVHEERKVQEDLRTGERRLRTLIEGIPQLVWRAAGNGDWTWVGPQWTAFTGLASDGSIGRGWLRALHPDDRSMAKEVWARADPDNRPDMELRICNVRTDRYRHFWSRAAPVIDAEGKVVEWLGTLTDIDDLHRVRDQGRTLVAELQHRTRNLLAVVRTLSDKTFRESDTLTDFRLVFQDRLSALARVQELLSLDKDRQVSFDELLKAELQAFSLQMDKDDQIYLSGPPGIKLQRYSVQTLALALHELANNAVKYGALSSPAGRLSVRWSLDLEQADGSPHLHVDWRETGVEIAPLSESMRRRGGYGRELIERALPYQLGARTNYELRADGVDCSIVLPIGRRKS